MSDPNDVLDSLRTLRDYVRWAASRFNEAGLFFGHGTDNALDEAAALVLHATHQPPDLHALYFDAALTHSERRRVVDLIEQRVLSRKPLPYLTGEAWFAGLAFHVDERVLVPRSPIAELIEHRFAPWIDDPDGVRSVLDLCAGSACIAIACAEVFPEAAVVAVDLSPDALEIATRNVSRYRLDGRVTLLRSDLFSALPPDARFDLIVSNPPYVSRDEWRELPAEYHAEPRLGLESGDDGLDCTRRILTEAAVHLQPGGILVVEVGNSAGALIDAYPDVPFTWMDFARGGEGVFMLTAEQLGEAFPDQRSR